MKERNLDVLKILLTWEKSGKEEGKAPSFHVWLKRADDQSNSKRWAISPMLDLGRSGKLDRSEFTSPSKSRLVVRFQRSSAHPFEL